MQMQDRLTITPKILELNQNSNDIYMTVKLCILSNQVNYNNAKFTDDFIQGVIDNKSTYIGIPLVANKTKLENGVYDKLTHEYSNGQLNTDVIGSFIDFWEETDDTNAKLLMGEARIYKRFPNVCEAILDLFESNDLEFSCEVLVTEYESVEDDVRSIHYNDGKNALIGSCVVTDPAESRSRATLLIAEALEKDLQNLSQKGDEKVSDTVLFNKGYEVKYHGKIHVSELSYDDIRDAIYNQVNPVDTQTNKRQYNYWIRELFQTYVILEDWNFPDKLYQAGYSVTNDSVVLDAKENWIEIELTYQKKGTDINQLLAEKQQEVTELNNKLQEVQNMNEEQVKELQEQLESLKNQVAELNATIVAQAEEKKSLESQVAELNQQIEELSKYKEQVEAAEKEAKKSALVEKFSKILSEEVFKSERVQNAIAELNEQELNKVVVEQVALEVANKQQNKSDDVTIVVNQKQEDFLPTDKKSYWYGKKSE
jgi:phage shock protein A